MNKYYKSLRRLLGRKQSPTTDASLRGNFRTWLVLLAFWTILMPKAAFAIATEPYDNTALPDGTNLLIFYNDFGQSTKLNMTNGFHSTGNNSLTDDIGIIRGIHFINLGDHTALLQVVQPFGTLQNISVDNTHYPAAWGAGDTIISGAVWLYEDKATSRYVSLTNYLSVPTGSYDSHAAFNIGTNRFSDDTQLAITYGLNSKFTLDMNFDYIGYSDNNNVNAYGPTLTLKQRSTEQAAFWLDYSIDEKSFAAVGFFSQFGGQELLDGAPNGLKTEEYRIRASYGRFVTPTVQLLLQINDDVGTVGGFQQGVGFEFRATKVF